MVNWSTKFAKEVSVNTIGDIHKLVITNKDARLQVKEGTKIVKLVIVERIKRTDLITNYEYCRHRFKDEGYVDGDVLTDDTLLANAA